MNMKCPFPLMPISCSLSQVKGPGRGVSTAFCLVARLGKLCNRFGFLTIELMAPNIKQTRPSPPNLQSPVIPGLSSAKSPPLFAS